MSENVKRTGRELAYQGSILNVYRDYMEFANGNTAVFDFIHHDGAAAVVPVLPDGRILMVRQYRNALERDTLEIPAGKLDAPGEEGIRCAARELEEETGYRSDQLEWLLTLRTTVAFCDEKIEIFTARDLKKTGQHLDEDEYVEVKAYTLEELKEKIFRGEIEDSKTIAAILAYEAKYCI
ncbi:NUDIX hydrolase [uncultured Merdimonas sp.]|uniref:NUDIX hydrolase n=1 Tax=uncultured Merdimonas sp. TaxID=2023269 RepID=UPI00320855AE